MSLCFPVQMILVFSRQQTSLVICRRNMDCIVALFVATLVSLGQACSPYEGWRPLTPAEKFQHANVVFYGKIIHTYKDDTWSSAYTAEMDVYCTLKGQQTAKKVNLTEAGQLFDGSNVFILDLRSSKQQTRIINIRI